MCEVIYIFIEVHIRRTPGELKDAVCSPGGTTICGVHALERAGLRCAAMDAVAAAYEKTCELAKG